MTRFYDLKTNRFFNLEMTEDGMPDYAADFACQDSRTRWDYDRECYTVPDGGCLIDQAADWVNKTGDWACDESDAERTISWEYESDISYSLQLTSEQLDTIHTAIYYYRMALNRQLGAFDTEFLRSQVRKDLEALDSLESTLPQG